MATSKKPLSMNPAAANSANHNIAAEGLQAEYQQRQRSPRPLPASVAKAYEVLIARGDLSKDASNSENY